MRHFTIAAVGVATMFFSLISFNCTSNNGTTNPPTTVTPITDNLFPLVAGNSFEYSGYLVDTNSVKTPAPENPAGVFSATWTLFYDGGNIWYFQDSTTVNGATTGKKLYIRKDSATGDFAFLQTLGPFYRAIHATYTDTALWVTVARPSLGMNNTWLAFDTTVNGEVNGISAAIHFQIFGVIEAREIITDSSSSHTQYNTYRIRTYRTISVGPISISTTSAYLWLAADIGPVQVDIAGDPENYGVFCVLKNKNF